MKKLILCLLLFGFISAGHSQILLKEAKVDYHPESMRIDAITNTLVVKLPEKFAGEFQNDPLTFMKNNFDVKKFIEDNREYDEFWVDLKSRKGHLAAKFNKKGELVSSAQKFKDVRLPENARVKILEKYRDAAIVGNKYLCSTKGWDINKEFYVVKIKEGDKTRRVRINKERELLSLSSL